MASPQHRDTKDGFLYAGLAYAIWGFLPLYMKLMAHIPAWEIVAHRILWSLPLTVIILWWRGLAGDLKATLQNRRMLLQTLMPASLISLNWGVYVWAVTSGRALETAFGYYINPLFSLFLASVLIGEKLSTQKIFAIGLALLAVALLTWEMGGLPVVSLLLALTWGFYAYLKRTLAIGPTEGFFVEILMLTIPSLAMLAWFEFSGQGHFLQGANDTALLMGSGFFTAIPLIAYAIGAKGLRLSTIAIMQYSAPTMIFLIAVFVFNEPFNATKLAVFVTIWLALAIYTWALVREHRAQKSL
jgi:chloramphenicol-sensitive protein RarD